MGLANTSVLVYAFFSLELIQQHGIPSPESVCVGKLGGGCLYSFHTAAMYADSSRFCGTHFSSPSGSVRLHPRPDEVTHDRTLNLEP